MTMNFATCRSAIRCGHPPFILLSLAGVYGFRQLPVANLPDLDLPAEPSPHPARRRAGAAGNRVARKVENSLAPCPASSICDLDHGRAGELNVDSSWKRNSPMR